MNKAQLEHVIRAAGAVCGEQELIVIGSQAILAGHDLPPPELVKSVEVDVYPRNAPEKSDLIDGAIGELSPFHEQFQYYAHGVGPETAVLPSNWKSRLIALQNENTGGVTAWCLSPIDLALSKLAAGRPKDLAFVQAMCQRLLITGELLATTANEMPPEHQASVRARIRRVCQAVNQNQQGNGNDSI